MVNITHSGENVEKIETIIEAARKRFEVYGLEKTSMKEIASDVGMSKGSLYYYFPDKEALYKAVIEKEQSIFIDKITEKIRNANDEAVMLFDYVNTRFENFFSLVNLGKFSFDEYRDIKPILHESWERFRVKESDVLKGIFQSGKDKGLFFIDDMNETVSNFLDILRCLFRSAIKKQEFLYLSEDDYKEAVKNVNTFTSIFIKGLKHQ